ncbi:type II toxin-antitoxin system RelE/ParE family toxin [Pseudomonas gingeri]|uniref:Type II toxin-antitoxin system RelE/ParE family toxin n=1 Tax=Pseudomonas gingeri TaxID=117681 RepID=A0A7Y8CJH3_9PSED|nr:type II toxin-antitoxin system RelE/ParE family toxin [Pseudomonas gingeri]NWC33052.1 type II toxin-antitoxin system RelE/ParE family toxin [Pseudomonas gingeri]NWD07988.1 type II toxin-antitoxin system RelE/ParE family toxin [Pseudomonas gingeri]NWD52101.1 type II toxin-antitoxin system RelE/ParE family toxin [Pseudomonas gingeri]NWE34561.1 type II toxin-antitoxin system RelE/ParE family toxin [Pseudomonas gingeri]
MIVQLTDEAEGDLERIGDYITQDNPLRALSFINELRDCWTHSPSTTRRHCHF